MKKIFSILLLAAGLLLCSNVGINADSSVSVDIPRFKITLNGTVMDNAYNKYPLLMYKDITYFPMTYDYARFLGLKANWYPKVRGYYNGGVLFIGVCPEEEKQNELKIAKTSNKNISRYTATIADYGLALNTVFNEDFIENRKEEYPILNFRNVSYFPLTWKYVVEEFGWEYSYTDEGGLKINSGDAFRPVIHDKVLGYTLPYIQEADYYYGKDLYVVYPHSTFEPVHDLVVRRRGEEEKRYNLKDQLYNGKYTILHLNQIENENGAFIRSKPYVEGNIFYVNCEGHIRGNTKSSGEILLGINLDNGQIISGVEK